ncbi:hypothetical protein [Pseudotamlana carrageenivorans]|uniref:Uncharacterized protein n=1 Tax=Pseudotamlana carrageenivorans TaxID=2069432 RepID=A0A2I7SGS6_9FLAO|nr:hypothetical protein [Tamlana carrageenivorans]AUS05119.1 hypothetical protein C1A40_06390 [Tamlana carrageenivorans]
MIGYTFLDFIDYQRYKELKSSFYNIYSKPTPDILMKYEESERQYVMLEFITLPDENGKAGFDIVREITLNDYFKDIIADIKRDYLYQVQKDVEGKYKFSREQLFIFVNSEIDLLEEYSNRIDKSEITYKTKSCLVETIKQIIGVLNDNYLPNEFLSFEEDKIKFKLTKKEVVLLFKKMVDAGFINSKQSFDKELGKLLDKHFYYFDAKSKTYVKMNDSYKTIRKVNTDINHQTPSEILNKFLK